MQSTALGAQIGCGGGRALMVAGAADRGPLSGPAGRTVMRLARGRRRAGQGFRVGVRKLCLREGCASTARTALPGRGRAWRWRVVRDRTVGGRWEVARLEGWRARRRQARKAARRGRCGAARTYAAAPNPPARSSYLHFEPPAPGAAPVAFMYGGGSGSVERLLLLEVRDARCAACGAHGAGFVVAPRGTAVHAFSNAWVRACGHFGRWIGVRTFM